MQKKLIKASEVKRKQMYTECTIAEIINSAMHARKTKIFLNTDLVEDKIIENLKKLGYNLYNKDSRLEVTWEYA